MRVSFERLSKNPKAKTMLILFYYHHHHHQCPRHCQQEDGEGQVLVSAGWPPEGNHIPSHGTEGAGSKRSGSNLEWLIVNHGKKKWASVWRPIATNSMDLEVSTANLMYTTELYKSVTVNEGSSGSGNAALLEGNLEDGERGPSAGEVETRTDAEVVLFFARVSKFFHLPFEKDLAKNCKALS